MGWRQSSEDEIVSISEQFDEGLRPVRKTTQAVVSSFWASDEKLSVREQVQWSFLPWNETEERFVVQIE